MYAFSFFFTRECLRVWVLRLQSADRTNRFSRECVLALTEIVRRLSRDTRPLVITGTPEFFSVGADLREIAALRAPAAYQFSKLGQELMYEVEQFPAPVFAAIRGYCMGGGLDLALACHSRIAAPQAVFGHRGAALGLITGWGGTQRLPRLVGKAKALEMFIAASKIDAALALRIGLLEAVVEDPVSAALHRAHAFLTRLPVDPAGCR
jgi:enoyl-CoA hydratase/carnithine racemase